MKKIFISVALLSGVMAMFSSCEDMLDIEQKAISTTATFYQTDEDAESAVTAMYATYIGEIGGNEGIWSAYIMGLNYAADDVFAAGGDIADHTGFREINEFRYETNFGPCKTLYNHIYKAIYSANLVINYFGGSADSPIKKQAVAEARVMRAWAHMLSAQVFYMPPLIDHLITTDVPVNAKSQEEIFKFCVKECQEAMADLPERQGANDKESAWRATKGFAQFVGGKAALFMGDNKTAAEMLKPLVESSNYALVPGERFRDLFHVEGDGCEEKIFEFNYSTNINQGGVWGGSIQRGRWMVANVLNWRGDDIVGGGKAPKICSTGGWGGGSINHEFAHKMLANDGDSYRRKATFLTSDEFFLDEKLCGWGADEHVDSVMQNGVKVGVKHHLTSEEKMYDFNRGIRKSAGSYSRSDVMEVKMMMHPNDAGSAVGDNCNNTNLCIARLGEAYLLYAEACLTTNAGEAKKYINLIQQRAGSKTISGSVDMQVLQDEKQYELWFEGCRWFDIVRWGKAAACYNKVLDNIPFQYDEFWETVGTLTLVIPKDGDKVKDDIKKDVTVGFKDGVLFFNDGQSFAALLDEEYEAMDKKDETKGLRYKTVNLSYQVRKSEGVYESVIARDAAGAEVKDLAIGSFKSDGVYYQEDKKTKIVTKPHNLRYEVRHPFKEAKINLKFTEGKNEYWPLPQEILDINDQLHQVRGWAAQ